MRADLLVNRAFQPFRVFRNRSSEGRRSSPRKPRGRPPKHFSDSIEPRKLADPTDRGKKLFQAPAPTKTPKTQSPKPAGPARLRARRRYTRPSAAWQAAFHKNSKNLNEQGSTAGPGRPSRVGARQHLSAAARRRHGVFCFREPLGRQFFRRRRAVARIEGVFLRVLGLAGCAATSGEA